MRQEFVPPVLLPAGDCFPLRLVVVFGTLLDRLPMVRDVEGVWALTLPLSVVRRLVAVGGRCFRFICT